jgi:neutral ceramidase
MAAKRILKLLLKALLVLFILLVLFLAFSIAPVDRETAQQQAFYSRSMENLDKLDSIQIPEPVHSFQVGYAKVNITPTFPASITAYGKRKATRFTEVRDSIFVRAVVVDNGSQKVAIVSGDLLIMPPTVVEILKTKLTAIGFSLDNTYLGATHTHNSIGNWGKGAARFFYGSYEEEVVSFIADKIVECIQMAAMNMKPSIISSGTVPVPQAVSNRLIKGGPEDPMLRVLEINRSDSTKLLLLNFTAHATCLYSSDLAISRDYPGQLVDTLEAKGYTFAMFMAGAVASHTCAPPEAGPNCIHWMAEEVSNTFLANRDKLALVADSTIIMVRVPFPVSNPQIKITPSLKVRSWLFRSALGEYPVYLTALRLGDVTLLGTPCDFSGEFSPQLDSVSSELGMQSMVTSFNGGYIGYVTPLNRYDVNHYETQLMNWYAPGTGEHMEESMIKLMTAISN